MSWELSSFLPLASCRSPSETDLLPTVDPGGCWRCCCFFCCWVFFLFVSCYFCLFFLTIGVHWIFFVLMHCEARESFSRPMRSGMCAIDGIVDWMVFCMAGKKNTHIWNICRMHMKNFTGNAHHIWILTEVKETRSMKRINQLRSIRSYLPVILEKCFVIRGQDVGEC